MRENVCPRWPVCRLGVAFHDQIARCGNAATQHVADTPRRKVGCLTPSVATTGEHVATAAVQTGQLAVQLDKVLAKRPRCGTGVSRPAVRWPHRHRRPGGQAAARATCHSERYSACRVVV